MTAARRHLTGGGGEAGYRSRTPEAQLSELIEAGLTTCVGVLGTDSVARSPMALLAKVKALTEDGLSCYMWTGAYAVPPPTVTGSLKLDIMAIEEVLGVGEVRGTLTVRQCIAALCVYGSVRMRTWVCRLPADCC